MQMPSAQNSSFLGVVFHAGSFSSGCLMWEKTKWGEFLTTKVELDISQTNACADSQWNPVYKAFHPICFCGNETIRQ